MRSVGVRELKERTGEILRQVAAGESVQVTHHGKVMAHLVPPPKNLSPEEIKQVLKGAHDLIDEIGELQTHPVEISEWRRW